MDLRNVIFAIALSFAVLFGWSTIFENPQVDQKIVDQKNENVEKKENQTYDSPSINLEINKKLSISRKDAINSIDRINFENDNVRGSISLEGALIDDILFKKYKAKIELSLIHI